MTRLPIIARLLLLANALALLTSSSAFAENPSFIGVWKGTSICQIKDSPCQDEVADYTVKKAAAPDSFEFSGNKVVDGQEIFMGVLACKLGSDSNMLVCRQSDVATWTWKVQGDKMSGTLMLRGQLYRKVQLTRTK